MICVARAFAGLMKILAGVACTLACMAAPASADVSGSLTITRPHVTGNPQANVTVTDTCSNSYGFCAWFPEVTAYPAGTPCPAALDATHIAYVGPFASAPGTISGSGDYNPDYSPTLSPFAPSTACLYIDDGAFAPNYPLVAQYDYPTLGSTAGALPMITHRTDATDNTATLGVSIPADCSQAAPGPVKFTITAGHTTRSATLANQCSGWTTSAPLHGSGWTVDLTGLPDLLDQSAGPYLSLSFPDGRNQRQVFSYRITFAGKAIKNGHITGRETYYPARMIYQGTDAFVNYCINDTRPVYSLNHKLYCDTVADTIVSWHFS